MKNAKLSKSAHFDAALQVGQKGLAIFICWIVCGIPQFCLDSCTWNSTLEQRWAETSHYHEHVQLVTNHVKLPFPNPAHHQQQGHLLRANSRAPGWCKILVVPDMVCMPLPCLRVMAQPIPEHRGHANVAGMKEVLISLALMKGWWLANMSRWLFACGVLALRTQGGDKHVFMNFGSRVFLLRAVLLIQHTCRSIEL